LKLAFYRTLTTPLIALKNLDDDAENDEHIPLIVAEVTDFFCFRKSVSVNLYLNIFNFYDTTMTLILKNAKKESSLLLLFFLFFEPALQRHRAENWKKIFPEMKLRGLIPNSYIHIILFIYSQDRSANLAAAK
jgi:hypothetical protein